MMISHYFHYINDQDMTYLCLTDKIFSKRAAFAYLEDIKEIFCLNYSPDARLNSIPMGMQSSFEEQMKTKMLYYNSQPENEKIQRLQNNLNDVKDQMVENIGSFCVTHSRQDIGQRGSNSGACVEDQHYGPICQQL